MKFLTDMKKLTLLITCMFLIACSASSHILVGEAREPINPSNVKVYLDSVSYTHLTLPTKA